MSAISDTKAPHWITSSFGGVLRGMAVTCFIYPLQVIKYRQQNQALSERAYQIAWKMFQSEGVGAFYKGITPQMISTSIKQTWIWPVITIVPEALKSCEVKDLPAQAITGFTIATLDSAILTPFEKAKIVSAVQGKDVFSFKNVFHNGWQAFPTQWRKQSAQWVTFLVAQKYLRDFYRQSPDEDLSLAQLAGIGTQIAVLASVVSAPLDFINTRRQAQNEKVADLRSEGSRVRMYFRGMPLNALALTIQAVASVVLIELLSKQYSHCEAGNS